MVSSVFFFCLQSRLSVSWALHVDDECAISHTLVQVKYTGLNNPDKERQNAASVYLFCKFILEQRKIHYFFVCHNSLWENTCPKNISQTRSISFCQLYHERDIISNPWPPPPNNDILSKITALLNNEQIKITLWQFLKLCFLITIAAHKMTKYCKSWNTVGISA